MNFSFLIRAVGLFCFNIIALLPAFGSDNCEILQAALDFRIAQEYEGRVCGIDAKTNQTYCVRGSTRSMIIGSGSYEFGSSGIDLSSRNFQPAVDISNEDKKKMRTVLWDVFYNELILHNREFRRNHAQSEWVTKRESDNNSIRNGDYLEGEIARLSESLGPNHQRVIKIKETYKKRHPKRSKANDKSTEILQTEIIEANQRVFDELEQILKDQSDKFKNLNQSKEIISRMNRQTKLNCRDKLVLDKDKIDMKETKNSNVSSGRFTPRELLIHPSEQFAVIMDTGRETGHYVNLRWRIIFLEKANSAWIVTGVAGKSPVFY